MTKIKLIFLFKFELWQPGNQILYKKGGKDKLIEEQKIN